ncbi:phosphoribosylamine--glycine ligase [Terribacillus saccharophilus]|uniref:phosphoribosylamine--glycine ligase n=1 Tax=Terribacillus saccharophilus TaxID=361277 RepID=UPI000BA61FF8|nr:phosphoribosylamine--glycine ligase [Terribacillus saccharophilus]PAF39525.1 phosphoribosylamine--glycine ligase [Terribacillus saccharophilus]
MKVLVIGSGGREHSIVAKLALNTEITALYAAPGNGGIADLATCVPIDVTAVDDLVHFAKEEQIDWTFVGPEIPLLAGVVNAFQQENLNVFGPTKEAALIEGSKDYAKSFMREHAIPTAASETFSDAEKAKAYIAKKGAPIVVKADGLAAGKGVVVANTVEEANEAVESMLVDNQFGQAGSLVIIEDFLDGKEFSLMAFVNGKDVYPLVPARDHKRVYDNDQGPNTGGMGAYAPIPDLQQKVIDEAIERILKPAAAGLVKEDRSFTGVLYAGLIETTDGPKVIEFNARFGDPETQVILPLLENDLLQVMRDVTAGNDPQLTWKDAYATGTVIAASGYPGNYDKQLLIPDLTELPQDVYCIHAGTEKTAEGYVSNGGRILFIGSVHHNRTDAVESVKTGLTIFKDNPNFHYRTDIGFGK